MFVERAHQIGGDHQGAAPDGDVYPAPTDDLLGRLGEDRRIDEGEEHDEQHTRQGCERGVPAAIEIGGRHSGQRVEPQHHALAAYDEIQQRRDGKEGKKEPQLLVDLFELPAERSARHEGCVSPDPRSTSKIF